MKKIYTIEKNGTYLMDTGMEPDWTSNWEDAQFYGSERQAKQDKDYFGLSLATVVEYEIVLNSPPSVPVEKKEDKKWHVYFIMERETNGDTHFKIGYSHDPIKRLNQLQTGHPLKLGLEGWLTYDTEEEAQEVEAAYHRFFTYYRTKGEWFKYSDSMDSIFEALKTNKYFTRYYC